jgi:hypothetical protein
LQPIEQVKDLGLDGNIQGGNRLIADNQPRVQSQGTGDTDTLPLAAGKLVRVAFGIRSLETH